MRLDTEVPASTVRQTRPKRRFLHPAWLIASLPCYVGWRLLPGLEWGPVATAMGVIALLAACVIIPFSLNTRSIQNRALADRLAWVGLLLMGFLSSLFVVTLMRDVFLLGAHLVLSGPEASGLTAPTARWAIGLTLLSVVLGFLIARRPRLVEVDIPIANLPPALHGFSIAQVSDLHVGPTIKRGFVERIVARVNRLQADVVAITGDLVDGSVRDLSAHTAPLRELTARDRKSVV